MRYENLKVDVREKDYLQFTSDGFEGDIALCGSEELISITNEIHKKQGNTDLVGTDDENDVYYNFYLAFNAQTKEVSIQAICNYGEKDDEVSYKLPMTAEEEKNVLFTLISCLAKEVYEN